MKKLFSKWEVLWYWQSGRTFSRWIGIEYQHVKGSKIYLLEIGLWWGYLEINYDGNYTHFEEI